MELVSTGLIKSLTHHVIYLIVPVAVLAAMRTCFDPDALGTLPQIRLYAFRSQKHGSLAMLLDHLSGRLPVHVVVGERFADLDNLGTGQKGCPHITALIEPATARPRPESCGTSMDMSIALRFARPRPSGR